LGRTVKNNNPRCKFSKKDERTPKASNKKFVKKDGYNYKKIVEKCS
jgi:hypothetical protein